MYGRLAGVEPRLRWPVWWMGRSHYETRACQNSYALPRFGADAPPCPGRYSPSRGAGGGLIPRRVLLLANRKADQARPKQQQAGDGEGEIVRSREIVQGAAELDAQRSPDLVSRKGEAIENPRCFKP